MDSTDLPAPITAGVEVTRRILERPGFRASVESIVRKLTGECEEVSGDDDLPVRQADLIAELLRSTNTRALRLGVDGVPGSGKSTLARALSERLSLRWRCLDPENLDSPVDLSATNTTFEHHRLLRTQNVDALDAIVYIDEPIERSKAKVLKRKRGGYLLEIMDFELLKRVGERAFAAASGPEFLIPQSYIRIKLRPPGGFAIFANTQRQLESQGAAVRGLSQEELLLLATTGRACGGMLAYVSERSVRELLGNLYGAVRVATGR